ncbi:proline hydroxylase [Pseudoalteromonas sp. NBT06-2]|uniref:2OG-Fe(II) oxygenase n=1 Tax=Pseudoalteromonas sp. NBT06-2 TaxID=2025950 RepID=UPI000BA6887F|nr:2OG-Fe(II) oxygenase [Pseudoalteromonas sp. NBT06-2]PAJ76092.1 proline hydroxylase [Pseudoalteromonas sp. NBT06-2]
MLDSIHHNGYDVIENAIPEHLIKQLYQNCLTAPDKFNSAGIGRQQSLKQDARIRTDKTFWLDSKNQEQTNYLALMDKIRLTINRYFYLGLFDYESHFAKYEIGDFYKKHLDAFKGRSNRVFTTVCYLNTPSKGGELLIYSDSSNHIIEKVIPKAGTLVVFESERFPHEVMPADDVRYSIAGWFRKNNSVSGTIDPSS